MNSSRIAKSISASVVALVTAAACTVSSQSARPTGDAAAARGHEPLHIDGEVLGVDEVPPGDRLAGNLRVQIRLDGKPIHVVLAPGWYLDEQGFKLEQHGRVQVVQASREGSSIVARSINLDGRLLQLRDAEGNPMWGVEPGTSGSVGSTSEGGSTSATDAPKDEEDDADASDEEASPDGEVDSEDSAGEDE